jgi:general secretion pathway protein K
MEPERTYGRHFTQKGIALIVVAGALAMLGVITTEFTTDADVEYEAAKNAQNDMRAHFLARSGMNLSVLVIKVQTDILDRYRRYIGDLQLADYLPMFVGAFGGNKDEVAALGEAVGGLETDAIKGLGLEEGEFDIEITTDDGKINVNCANGAQSSRTALQTQLEAMLFPAAYDELFQYEDAEGWRRDRPTQVAAIIDYIDRDNAAYGAPGTPEEYGYDRAKGSYLPKDNYIDTVGELQLVRGVDDRFWTLFGSAFTVYGGCKQNVGAIQDVNVIASIIYISAKNPDDPVLRDPAKLWALAQYVAQARNLGVMFDELQAFADFVKEPAGALGDLFGADPASASGGAGGAAAAAGVQFPEGVELDMQKLGQVARTGPRRTYRVETTARIGRVEKKIVGVWDTNVQRQQPRDGQGGKGTWVFWREE